MLNLIVRIKSVDMFGMCGRENHPERTDEGKLARVFAVETLTEDTTEEIRPLDESQNHGDEPISVYYAILDGGRLVDLMEYEVDFVRAEPKGGTLQKAAGASLPHVVDLGAPLRINRI